jgi:hypothetical protein
MILTTVHLLLQAVRLQRQAGLGSRDSKARALEALRLPSSYELHNKSETAHCRAESPDQRPPSPHCRFHAAASGRNCGAGSHTQSNIHSCQCCFLRLSIHGGPPSSCASDPCPSPGSRLASGPRNNLNDFCQCKRPPRRPRRPEPHSGRTRWEVGQGCLGCSATNGASIPQARHVRQYTTSTSFGAPSARLAVWSGQ